MKAFINKIIFAIASFLLPYILLFITVVIPLIVLALIMDFIERKF